MIKITLVIIFCGAWISGHSKDMLFIHTDREAYVAGETLYFTIWAFDSVSLDLNTKPYMIYADLVQPDGEVVITLTIPSTSEHTSAFVLPDSLRTGIYRIIVYAPEKNYGIKRVNIYSPKIKTPEHNKYAVSHLVAAAKGNSLIKGVKNKVAVHVTTNDGNGLPTKGTVFTDTDSLVTYIQTDLNGVGSFEVVPNASRYKIKFGDQETSIAVADPSSYLEVSAEDDTHLLRLHSQTNHSDDAYIQVKSNETTVKTIKPEDFVNGNFELKSSTVPYGILNINYVVNGYKTQSFKILNKPTYKAGPEVLAFNTEDKLNISVPETANLKAIFVEVNHRMNNQAHPLGLYEELFFDQKIDNLQSSVTYLFEDYLILADELITPHSFSQEYQQLPDDNRGFCNTHPYHRASFLFLNNFNVVEVECSDYNGLASVQNKIDGESSKAFAYYFDPFLKPAAPIGLEISKKHQYSAISSTPVVDKSVIALISNYNKRQSILLSYNHSSSQTFALDTADFTYKMDEYKLPNTVEEVLNQIVRFASVKRQDNKYEIRLFRYASSYKFDNKPLILINGVPTFDQQVVFRIEPRFIDKIEVVNATPSLRPFGSFGLNGVLAIYLKNTAENPLREKLNDLPELYNVDPTRRFNYFNPLAPDVRQLLYLKTIYNFPSQKLTLGILKSDVSGSLMIQVFGFTNEGAWRDYRIIQE